MKQNLKIMKRFSLVLSMKWIIFALKLILTTKMLINYSII